MEISYLANGVGCMTVLPAWRSGVFVCLVLAWLLNNIGGDHVLCLFWVCLANMRYSCLMHHGPASMEEWHLMLVCLEITAWSNEQ